MFHLPDAQMFGASLSFSTKEAEGRTGRTLLVSGSSVGLTRIVTPGNVCQGWGHPPPGAQVRRVRIRGQGSALELQVLGRMLLPYVQPRAAPRESTPDPRAPEPFRKLEHQIVHDIWFVQQWPPILTTHTHELEASA